MRLKTIDNETWRGRIRACRGVGATLTSVEPERFDAEHRKLLENNRA